MHLRPLNLASPFHHLLLILLATPTTPTTPKPKNAILLSKVESLTLRANAPTTHRRTASPIPQLRCISNPSEICERHAVDVLRCTNQGPGYGAEDVQWSCTTPSGLLPVEVRLGGTEVSCEGYDGPEDDYVLRGSCGVEYRLVLTDEGERRYPDLAEVSRERWTWDTILFGVVFVGVLVFILAGACRAAGEQREPRAPRRPRGDGRGGGGGDGGWGPGWGPGGGGGSGSSGWDDDDPPPPYPGTKLSQRGRWKPGFWTGLGGGAAAGYVAGNMAGSRREDSSPQRRSGNSGWGSNYASSSSSSAMHRSTGFGVTSRR